MAEMHTHTRTHARMHTHIHTQVHARANTQIHISIYLKNGADRIYMGISKSRDATFV